MDFISWDDFLNLSDTTPIDEAIKKITALKSSFTTLADDLAKDNARLTNEYTTLAGQAGKMSKTISDLNIAQKDHQETILNEAKAIDALSNAAKKNAEATKANEKAAKDMLIADEALNKAKEKLTNSNKTEAGSLDALKKQLEESVKKYKALGEATDQSVKDAHLKKINELSKQHNEGAAALVNAKKATVAAAGSYDELNTRVILAKKALKGLQGGIGGNTDEFNKLQKEVAEGTETLKQWDNKIGDNQRKVGDYEGALKGLKVELRAAKDELAGIAATLGDNSEEYKLAAARAGALNDQIGDIQDATKAVSGEPIERLSGSFGLLADKIKAGDFKGATGAIKQISLASKDMTFKQATQGLGGFTKGLGTMAKAIFTNPLFLLAGLAIGIGVAIYKLRDSLTPLRIAFEYLGAAGDAVVGTLKEFSDWLGISTFAAESHSQSILDSTKKKLAATTSYYEDEIALAEAAGASTIRLERAKLENDLFVAKRRLHEMEIMKGRRQKIEQEEYDAMIKLAHDAYLALKILAIKKENDEKKASDEKKTRDIKNSEDRKERITKDSEAEFQILKFAKERELKNQEEIAANEVNSLDTRLKANDKAATLKRELIEMSAKHELENTTLTANQRKLIQEKSNAELLDEEKKYRVQRNEIQINEINEEIARLDILSTYEKNSFEERQGNVVAAGVKRLEVLDLQLFNQQISEQTYTEAVEAVHKKLNESLFALQEDRFAKEKTIFETKANENLSALINAYSQGIDSVVIDGVEYDVSSVKDFEKNKLKIQEESEKQSLKQQLEYLKEQASNLESGSKVKLDLLQKISAVELQINSDAAKLKEQFDKDVIAATEELKQASYDAAIGLVQGQFDKEAIDIQNRLVRLKSSQELELALAGTNEEAKSKIKADYARREQALLNQQGQQRRKQAIFDKAQAVFTIAVNTGVAISKAASLYFATGGLPLTAILAAVGALQIASVLARPIPQFAEGTMSAPGGISIVNELGREIIEEPSGKMKVINTDGATYTNLKKGSRVYTHDESMAMLNNSFGQTVFGGMRADSNEIIEVSKSQHDKELASILKECFGDLSFTIKRNKSQSITRQEMQEAIEKGMANNNYKTTFK